MPSAEWLPFWLSLHLSRLSDGYIQFNSMYLFVTKHASVNKIIIGSDNGLVPAWHQAII